MRVRHVACMEHRAEAQKVSGVTEAQSKSLSLGREKGTNHREGYKHKEESKTKASDSHKEWCRLNPDKVSERGKKTRGEAHYQWNGGISKLNTSIRQMTENRRWMDGVKLRDRVCVKCGCKDDLESHHIVPLSQLLQTLSVASRDDARKHAEVLWNLENGETLCSPCHYQKHGRDYNANQ